MENKLKIEVLDAVSGNDLAETLDSESNLGYFIFCNSGKASLSIDSILVKMSANCVINIISSAHTLIKDISSETNLTIIAYNEVVKNILSSHSLAVFCPVTGMLQTELRNEEFSDLLFYVNKIKRCNTDNNPPETALLNLILIVKELSQLNNLSHSVRRMKNEIILNFINLLDQSYKTDKSIDSYCLQMHISTKTLYRAFKQDLGISPKEFMNFKLNMEAKKLLIHSELSIKEIAHNMGFQSQYYFTNFFKKVNHTSPSLFKEEMSDFSIIMS